MIPNKSNSECFKYIMKRMDNIIAMNNPKNCELQVKNYLVNAYSQFTNWSRVFNLHYLNSITPKVLQKQVSNFTEEKYNGSWTGLNRNKGKIINSTLLKTTLIYLLSYKTQRNVPLMKDVISRIETIRSKNSQYYIPNMSVFFCTAILFAHDPNNFMVINGPTRDIFFFSKSVKAQLNSLQKITRRSKSILSNYTNLSMWHLNKAFAIYMNEHQIKLKNLVNYKIPPNVPSSIRI